MKCMYLFSTPLATIAVLVLAAGATAQEAQTDGTTPYAAWLLIVKADWSQSLSAKTIEKELREALQGLNVPQDSLDKLPGSATEILFPPCVGGIYTSEHFAQFMAWLKANQLVHDSLPF